MLSGRVCAVSGASGFVGCRLTQILLDHGAAVRALVRTTSSATIPPPTDRIACEYSDGRSLASALEGVEILFNCVGYSADWGSKHQFEDGNVRSVERLWRAAAQAKVDRLVHISTTDVYGYPWQACDESHALTDVGLPYNRSKIQGERLARELGEELNLKVLIVRPATIFGPGSDDFVLEVSRELQRGKVPLFNGGKSNAGLVFVDDVALAIIRLAETHDAGDFNIIDPRPLSWREYFAELCEVLEVREPVLNIPESLAMILAHGNEAVWRLLRIENRPLLTRHVVSLMCRDQHYDVSKLRAAVPEFPFVGLELGLDLTKQWLRGQLDEKSGKL
jgi:nucleoside-diphosphate-sugar epimerase